MFHKLSTRTKCFTVVTNTHQFLITPMICIAQPEFTHTTPTPLPKPTSLCFTHTIDTVIDRVHGRLGHDCGEHRGHSGCSFHLGGLLGCEPILALLRRLERNHLSRGALGSLYIDRVWSRPLPRSDPSSLSKELSHIYHVFKDFVICAPTFSRMRHTVCQERAFGLLLIDHCPLQSYRFPYLYPSCKQKIQKQKCSNNSFPFPPGEWCVSDLHQ